VLEHYWCGEWDAAATLADRLLAERNGAYIDGMIRVVRGRIALARGDGEAALADSERALRAARVARDSQFFFPALALRARVVHETGEGDAGALVDELLAAVRRDEVEIGSYWPDLSVVLLALDRRDDLLAAVARLQAPTRWAEAAKALALGDFARAASIYTEIGSRPDEDFARLQAGALDDAAVS
jgi:hypothetical protein